MILPSVRLRTRPLSNNKELNVEPNRNKAAAGILLMINPKTFNEVSGLATQLRS